MFGRNPLAQLPHWVADLASHVLSAPDHLADHVWSVPDHGVWRFAAVMFRRPSDRPDGPGRQAGRIRGF